MNERPRVPARYYQDQFRFTKSGIRWSELTDEQLLAADPSRAPLPEPPPPDPPPDELDP
jgi:hypothetical protein